MTEIYIKMICIILMCITYSYAYRSADGTITVDNGGEWGDWQRPQFCPRGQYAIGYKLKIEESLGRFYDDSALNGIELLCGTAHSRTIDGYTVTSGVGAWGDWHHSLTVCPDHQFMSSFKMQVESYVGRHDDTSANFVVFRCRTAYGRNEIEIRQGNGRGLWGSYGSWSRGCPLNSVICGLKTRLEGPQGNGDDTALNDIMFYCCIYW